MITASESSKIGNGAHLCFLSDNLAQILCYVDLLSAYMLEKNIICCCLLKNIICYCNVYEYCRHYLIWREIGLVFN